jgi:hypothetical protein
MDPRTFTDEKFVTAAERVELLKPSPVTEAAEQRHIDWNTGCVSCGVERKHCIHLRCDHYQCALCLRLSVKIAFRDVSIWPPRCCEHFTEAEIRAADNTPGLRLLQLWQQTRREQQAGRRVYCHDPKCAFFIDKRFITDDSDDVEEKCRAWCPVCFEKTCAKCRKKWHPDGKCEETTGKEQSEAMDLMDRHGFTMCARCGNVMQLSEGCNHIT